MGASMALPFLDAMAPAFAGAVKSTPRLGFIYISNGVIQDQWIPATTGKGFELSPILKPLGALRDDVNILSGLSHLPADTVGDGTGDHPRSSAVWLTGVHAYDRSRPDIRVHLATSADQLAAKEFGKVTQVPSIEINLDLPQQGACDTSDCFFNNTISWRTPTTPNAAELHPRLVFERLFGDGGNVEERMMRMKRNRSILDSVIEEAHGIEKTLGAGDRTKLSEYLDSVREIEQRIQSVETRGINAVGLPERPTDIPSNFEEHIKLMFDLQLLGFRADVTRVFTMMVCRELSTRPYPQIGVNEGHHPVSHHRNSADLIAKKAKIDNYHVQLLAYFLETLKTTSDGDGSLLDQSMILYGGGMGDGNMHRHNNLPCLMAGKLGGQFQTGRHLAYKLDTPMSNLLVTILNKAGVQVDQIGDSTGPLEV
jgi:hypothetical protein